MDTNILLAILVVLFTINAIALLVRFNARTKTRNEPSEEKQPPRVILSTKTPLSNQSPKINIRE
jgi:hypothetical protein